MGRFWKKCTMLMLSFTMLSTSAPLTVLAETQEEEVLVIEQGMEAETIRPDVEGWPEPVEITAETGVIMELTTAIVQYNKGRDEIRYIGELAKYMTLLLAAENCDLEEEITFTENAVQEVEKEHASIDAKEGEIMTVKDCMYAVSLAAADDAAVQLAEYVGGTEEDFLKMMNKRAKQLGCVNTHFASVTGTEDEESYSTAYDMALIIRAGIKNENFRKITAKSSYTIKKTNLSKKRRLTSGIGIIDEESEEYYDRCRIAAAFSTEKNGCNMILAAKKNDVTFIVVTFGSPTEELSYEEGRKLLDYAHDNFIKLEYKIGTLVWPKAASTDVIEVTGKTENEQLIHRYYVGNWLVGKGSQDLFPPKAESDEVSKEEEESEEDTEKVTGRMIESDEDSDEEWNEIEDEEFEDESDEEGISEDGIDLVVTEKEEYFTIYGYSLTEWEHMGALVIVVGAILILFGTLIKIRWKASVRKKKRARWQRIKEYEEETKNQNVSEE